MSLLYLPLYSLPQAIYKFLRLNFQYQKCKKLADFTCHTKQSHMTKNPVSKKVSISCENGKLVPQNFSLAVPHKLCV